MMKPWFHRISALNTSLKQGVIENFKELQDQVLPFAFNGQNLAAFIIAAGSANSMSRHGAAALGALCQLRRMPAVGRLARSQPHLRGFAFWDSHVSVERKQEISKIQMRCSCRCPHRQIVDGLPPKTAAATATSNASPIRTGNHVSLA